MIENNDSFVNKMRTLQNNIENHYKQRKTLKEQRYRAFLKNPQRTLPDYQTLARWRKKLFLAALLSLAPSALGTFFLFDMMYIDYYGFISIPVFCGSAFLIIGCFAATVDYVIYRRWGNQKTFIHW